MPPLRKLGCWLSSLLHDYDFLNLLLLLMAYVFLVILHQ